MQDTGVLIRVYENCEIKDIEPLVFHINGSYLEIIFEFVSLRKLIVFIHTSS